ncbi:hypothetical protein [uncultured Tateyamaria sp.]|uniref:hypothetical protein n=1 Tax=uncultured Tateyamaria sp. TaxID=455651 RepID=UPI00261E5B45|nr:hypothetical protein [uncultured Tateyamaria sp.]
MGALLKSLFSGLTDISLSEPEHRARIAFDTVKATPAMERRAATEDKCRALVSARNWTELSDHLIQWDQSRAACNAGIPLAQIGRQAVLFDLADAVVEGHDCHPDPIAIFSDEVVQRMETLSAMHPEKYPLLALAAEMRCYQGWSSRGADYAEYVSDNGWFGMGQHFAKAAWLLEKYDVVEMNAPLLAAARHRLLGFMPDADKHVGRFYEEWSALDPKDQEPHEKHAIMMLPRWFGTQETLEIEAQKAAVRTTTAAGDAAYFTMYRRVFDAWDPSVLNMDTKVLKRGAHDLITLRGDDPAFVAQLVQDIRWWTGIGSGDSYTRDGRKLWSDITTDIEEMRQELVLSRLTAICPDAWEDGPEGALDMLSECVQADIRAGATFQLGKSGLEIFPQDEPLSSGSA